jgi:hypothetical protein
MSYSETYLVPVSYPLDQALLTSPVAATSCSLIVPLNQADGNLGIDPTIDWNKRNWDRFDLEEMNRNSSRRD